MQDFTTGTGKLKTEEKKLKTKIYLNFPASRFFYDSSASPAKFTEAQLGEVRKSSLARITCDNGDNINSIQPLAFRTPTLM